MIHSRKKVIKGLECCTGRSIACFEQVCPYADASGYVGHCRGKLLKDALALLKEQQKQIEQMNFIYGFVYGGQVKEIKKLVLCKDCKHHGTMDCPMCEEGNCIFHTADNWFCADGERREGR